MLAKHLQNKNRTEELILSANFSTTLVNLCMTIMASPKNKKHKLYYKNQLFSNHIDGSRIYFKTLEVGTAQSY
jgi:hypothetical protein